MTVTQDQNGATATFDGTSTEAISIPEDIEVDAVTLNREYSNGKCATLMLPFSLGEGQTLTGGTLYRFSGVTKESGKWVATLTATTTLKANTPYLIAPDGNLTDGKLTFGLNGGRVTLNTTTAGEDTNDADELWDFIGTYSYREWVADGANNSEIGRAYGFAGVQKTDVEVGDFVRVASGAKIRPMSCYLLWKGSDAQNVRALTRGAAATSDEELPSRIAVRLVGAKGETTGIGTLDTRTGEVTFDGWYTLDGVRLDGKPSKPGPYINNGKKVIIK